ncbi:hypothetical protein B9J78_04585 [bacterium Unc6]|nr:hypothetical protein [bacterium Unc6]
MKEKLKNINIIYVYADGGSLKNSPTQSDAGIGAILYDKIGNEIAKKSEFIGTATNNVAEYRALIFGIKTALVLRPRAIKCFTDSELVVKQINGEYRCKNIGLKMLLAEIDTLSTKADVTFEYIPRENEKIRAVHKLVEKTINNERRRTPAQEASKKPQEKQKTFQW